MTPRTIAAAAMLAMMAVPVPVGTSSSTPLLISAETAPHGFTKMIIVVLENTNYADALQQSFLASLAKRGALLTNFTAEAHPSQPNYIALISGSTHDVTSDRNVTLDARHVGDLLEAKSLQWKVYAEGYPGNCFLGTQSGTYVRKHVPFLSFKNVQTDPSRCARIVESWRLTYEMGSCPTIHSISPISRTMGTIPEWLMPTAGFLPSSAHSSRIRVSQMGLCSS
jgi:Phosphoesterase family